MAAESQGIADGGSETECLRILLLSADCMAAKYLLEKEKTVLWEFR